MKVEISEVDYECLKLAISQSWEISEKRGEEYSPWRAMLNNISNKLHDAFDESSECQKVCKEVSSLPVVRLKFGGSILEIHLAEGSHLNFVD